MELLVRRLLPEELDAALALAWEVYLEFEAPDYGPEGVEAFRADIMENELFKDACRRGENRMWGAFDGDKLAGMFAMRGAAHICLVFTRREYQRRGVATAIFRRLEQDVRRENPGVGRLTLNSSPYGGPFYHWLGFAETDSEQVKHGIRFTPMAYILK